MLTPKAMNIISILPAMYPTGIKGHETIAITSTPMPATILSYNKVIRPVETNAAKRPIIIPSEINGPLINQLVAPTYYIMRISLALANTVSLTVLETTTTETTIKNAITIKAPI